MARNSQRQLESRWPLGTPGERIAEGHFTCAVQCTSRKCSRNSIDIRLETLPTDLPWTVLGPRMACRQCGTVGAVNVVPNWYDRAFQTMPLVDSKGRPRRA
jgi:hypothetical protein